MRAYERFLKYAKYPTMSDESSTTTPSTTKQLVLARELLGELRALGLHAEMDEYGYVYAHLEPTAEGANAIGFIAHLDTSSEASDENIKPTVVKYSGGDILLNGEKGIYMRVADYPYLADYVGKSLIVSDGTTLIGADDKAGIAEIMTALERIIAEKIPHGKVCVAFTPDEEIGAGADHFDVARFGADYAYTVDGGALGELEYENFNAASAKIRISGVSIHPGSAKGMMKNAARIATELCAMLPEGEIPELTEGYEGFYHLLHMEGGCESATLSFIIRDHDMALFEKRKAAFVDTVRLLNEKYGEGTVELTLTDSYYNMRERIEDNMFIVERAAEAMRSLGVEPRVMPIRGGTDGSRLSFMGLPCPNLCTGGVNFHSRFEYVATEDMDVISDILVALVKNAVTDGYRKVKI